MSLQLRAQKRQSFPLSPVAVYPQSPLAFCGGIYMDSNQNQGPLCLIKRPVLCQPHKIPSQGKTAPKVKVLNCCNDRWWPDSI